MEKANAARVLSPTFSSSPALTPLPLHQRPTIATGFDRFLGPNVTVSSNRAYSKFVCQIPFISAVTGLAFTGGNDTPDSRVVLFCWHLLLMAQHGSICSEPSRSLEKTGNSVASSGHTAAAEEGFFAQYVITAQRRLILVLEHSLAVPKP